MRAPPSKEWDVAKTYWSAIDLLRKNKYMIVDIDHDLGDFVNGREYTGYDILMYIRKMQLEGEYIPKHILVHTANPVGRDRMLGLVDTIKRGL